MTSSITSYSRDELRKKIIDETPLNKEQKELLSKLGPERVRIFSRGGGVYTTGGKQILAPTTSPPPVTGSKISSQQQIEEIRRARNREVIAERNRILEAMKRKARERGINISTRAREVGFINQLRREAREERERLKKIDESKNKIKTKIESGKIKTPSSMISARPISEVRKQNLSKLEAQRQRLITKTLRGKSSAKDELLLAGIGFATTFVEFSKGIKELPKTITLLVKNPKIVKEIPGSIMRSGAEFGDIIDTSPGEAIGRVGGNIVILKGTSQAFKTISKTTKITSAKISPKYVGTAKVGEVLKIETTTGRIVKLPIVGRIGSKGLKRLTSAEQISIAGKEVDAVSTQADELVSLIRTKRVIRKPIPNEDKLSSTTKKLLKKFDEGKIKSNELIKLNNLITRQGEKGLLERSFFADPLKRVRPSRFGIPKDASLIDILSGDVTFKGSKPQILLFEKTKVQKLPKSLKDIEIKLKLNKPLTEKETNRLLKFQLQKSGKFKPIGFASGEPEVTIAPGELIKKVKKVGVAIINNERVSIVQVKVVKPSKRLSKLIKKSKTKKLTFSEKRNLNKLLKKETGFSKPKLSSKRISSKKVSLKRVGASSLSSVLRRSKRISKPYKISKSPKPYKPSKPSRPSKPYKPSKPSRPSKPYKPSKPYRSGKPSKPSKPSKPYKPSKPGRPSKPGIPSKIGKPILKKISKTYKKKKKPTKPQQVFNVFGKVKKKFIKINKTPLRKIDALSKGAFAVDRTTARTFKIQPVGRSKKFGNLLKGERGYFNKARNKLRQVRIKKGKQFKLINKYIEKRKYGIDTYGEKKGLSIRRLIVGRTRPKRKITPKQRKVLLNNLKKARRIKLKGGKRR